MGQFINKLKLEIIEALNLEGVEPDEIDASAPLFNSSLGLDSIDALELIVLLERNYGIKVTDPDEGREIFHSVNTIAEFVKANQK